MRDERRQPRLRSVDGEAVEDVRPNDFWRKAVHVVGVAKSIAGAVSTVGLIVGILAGAGKWALSWAGIATTAGVAVEIKKATDPLIEDKVARATRDAKIDKALTELSAQVRSIGDAEKKPEHRGRKRAPAIPETKEGDRE